MNSKRAVAGAAIALAAILCAGAATHDDGKNAVLVEEVYIVKPGDTLEELNPWLLERHGLIYPGDKLTLTYWIRGDE